MYVKLTCSGPVAGLGIRTLVRLGLAGNHEADLKRCGFRYGVAFAMVHEVAESLSAFLTYGSGPSTAHRLFAACPTFMWR